MNRNLSLDEISNQLKAVSLAFTNFCSSLSDEQFFYQPPAKWSAAQQVKHLVTATNTSRLAFTLPKFMVRIVGGKPNRASRTYDELVEKYKGKLEKGGRASGRYIPKPIPASFGKEKMLGNFRKAMQQFDRSVNNWEESQTDNYLAPHPLLGKITLRELCYFTIHHTQHHQESIRKMLQP